MHGCPSLKPNGHHAVMHSSQLPVRTVNSQTMVNQPPTSVHQLLSWNCQTHIKKGCVISML